MQVINNTINSQYHANHHFAKIMDFYKKVYKARFVHGGTYNSMFRYSNCVLPISVGQDYHQDIKLKAIVELVNKNFMSCTVVIADLLQRHTLLIENNITERDAYDLAIKGGDNWYTSQLKYFSKFVIPHKIVFWHQWLYSPDYKPQRLIIDNLYKQNLQIHEAFNLTVENFISRYSYLDKIIDKTTIKEKALEYVKEECSIMPLWVKDKFHFEIYPANRTPAMNAIYNLLVKPHHPELLRWLRIELRSKLLLVKEVADIN